MQTMLEVLRSVVGQPSFENAAVLEYFFCGLIVVIVISSAFKILVKAFER